MSELLKLTGPNHRALVKEAFIGTGLRLMSRVGKVIVKNPLKTLGVGFTMGDALSGTKRITDAASGARNIAANVGRATM